MTPISAKPSLVQLQRAPRQTAVVSPPARRAVTSRASDGMAAPRARLPSVDDPAAGRTCVSTGAPATPAAAKPMSLVELMHQGAKEHLAASLARGEAWAVAAQAPKPKSPPKTSTAPSVRSEPIKEVRPVPLPPGVERTSTNWLGILTPAQARQALDPRIVTQTEELWKLGRLQKRYASLDDALVARANTPPTATGEYLRWTNQATTEELTRAGRVSEIPRALTDPRFIELVDFLVARGVRNDLPCVDAVRHALDGGVSLDTLKQHFGALVNKFGPRTFHYAHRLFAMLDTSTDGLERLKSGAYTQSALDTPSGGTRYA